MAGVVCDAGPLIHLDELGALDLASDMGTLLVPEQVWVEVSRHRPVAPEERWGCLSHVEVACEADPRVVTLARALLLNAGEQSAITLALNTVGSILLCDDAAARLAAESLGIRVHGTLGVLLRAARRRLRSRADVLALLAAIPTQSSLHVRPRLLDEVIRSARAEFHL